MTSLSYYGVHMDIPKYPFLFGLSLSIVVILILPLFIELVYIFERI